MKYIYSIPTQEIIFLDNHIIRNTLTEVIILFANKFPESKTSSDIIINYYYSQF
jgi:hypothetical protein